MKTVLLFLLLLSALNAYPQEDLSFEDSNYVEEDYEAEVFTQKQEESYTEASSFIDTSQEALEDEEVYDPETDY